MKTKNKKSDAKKLYNLLSDAEVISDGERMFWLENFSNLSEAAQIQLAETIKAGEKELRSEHDAHFARIAEIDTKVVAQLQTMAKANGLKASAGDDDEGNEDLDVDKILQEVRQFE
ncbi:hypothetical protein K9N08_04880 [Candidatus Gracilibacteria bacterium]|nr:hypothetical protein [Candidatus Gracilibacteria bacterium]MCF7897117.1 hypothetical protein [Candidatus Gracilibacteria bacterium]